MPLFVTLAGCLLLATILLGLSAFFSGSETAFFSLGPLVVRKLKEDRHPRVEILESLLGRPRRLITTILLGNAVASGSIAIVIAAGFWLVLAGLELGELPLAILSILITTSTLLVLGEVTPKALATRNPLRFSLAVARPLALIARVADPARQAIRFLVDRWFAVMSGGAKPGVGLLCREDLPNLASVAEKSDVLEPSERHFIQKVFHFGDTTVQQIMTPRTDMVSLGYGLTIPQLVAEVKASEYSRVPLYRGRRDNIVGIVYAKDLVRLVRCEEAQRNVTMADLMKPPYYVPASKKVGDLFRELRARKLHIAIVVDEYGGVAGLVTMEDLLEELFGEISDEYDLDEEHLKILGEDTFLVSSRMPIDQFNEALDTQLPIEPNRTVGGFVLDLFGHVPEPGSRMDHADLVFTVVRATEGRIEEIKVRRVSSVRPRPAGTGGGEGTEDDRA